MLLIWTKQFKFVEANLSSEVTEIARTRLTRIRQHRYKFLGYRFHASCCRPFIQYLFGKRFACAIYLKPKNEKRRSDTCYEISPQRSSYLGKWMFILHNNVPWSSSANMFVRVTRRSHSSPECSLCLPTTLNTTWLGFQKKCQPIFSHARRPWGALVKPKPASFVRR